MARKRRRTPPVTAHRLAAWLSLAQGLNHSKAHEIRFPPSEDDVGSFVHFWRARLRVLREAGVRALGRPTNFNVAAACKPFAFSYAGHGQSCRRWFCPFCNAAAAAETYERLRRVVDRYGKSIGFVMNRETTREGLSDLPSAIRSFLVRSKSGRNYGQTDPSASIIKCIVWPHEYRDETAVVQPWTLRRASRICPTGIRCPSAGFANSRKS